MKKLLPFSIFALLFMNLFLLFGHGGGLDSDGGHYNHSTGDYHYHHGLKSLGAGFYLLIGLIVFIVFIQKKMNKE